MQLTSTKEHKTRKQIYLSNKQKWSVATWCIENRSVIQDYDPKNIEDIFYPYSIWRVNLTQTAKEFNNEKFTNVPTNLTSHHMKISIEFYNEICELTQHWPTPNPIQDTVEMDALTATNKRLENDIKEMVDKHSQLFEGYKKLANDLSTYKEILHKIFELLPADIFGMKKKQLTGR